MGITTDPVMRPTTGADSSLLVDELTRTQRQLTALDLWHQARRAAEQAAALREQTREQRMDVARRMEVLREEHRVIVERSDRALRQSAVALVRSSAPRVVIAHRSPWLIDKLATALEAYGAHVVGRVSDGAEAVGVVVVDQPDLLLVEHVLPRLSGEDVIREVRRYAPQTVIAAHVDYDDAMGSVLDAGARAAFARKIPPAELARDLVALLIPAQASATSRAG